MSTGSRRLRILLCDIHWPGFYGYYLMRAFKRLGHEVVTVGIPSLNELWHRGVLIDPKLAWWPDIPIGDGGFRRCSEVLPAIAGRLNGWQPDLILNASSNHLAIVGPGPCPIAYYAADNHLHGYYNTPGIDYWFIAHSAGHLSDHPDAHWIPCGFDPVIHQCYTPLAERPYHAAMIGALYDDRRSVLGKLVSEFSLLVGRGPILDEYAALYNQAVVSVCHPLSNDVAMRVFESAAMGNVILAKPAADFERLGLEADRHYLAYDTPTEAVERMRTLFAMPADQREALSLATREWAIGQSWDHRAQQMLNIACGQWSPAPMEAQPMSFQAYWAAYQTSDHPIVACIQPKEAQ